jgi:hypothetical protein
MAWVANHSQGLKHWEPKGTCSQPSIQTFPFWVPFEASISFFSLSLSLSVSLSQILRCGHAL